LTISENEFQEVLKTFKLRIDPLEVIINSLAENLGSPFIYDSGQQHHGFRYYNPKIEHFCLLKSVRVVSALNAMLLLAQGGFMQEINVLIRTLIECTTHIEYVLSGRDDTGQIEPEIEIYIKAYFSDFARNRDSDFKYAQVKQKKVNKRLGSTLDNFANQKEKQIQIVESERLYSSIYLNFSNYVHAKYPEVMDLYGGEPPYFHLHGMRHTPKDSEIIQWIDSCIDTTSLALRLMISSLRLHSIVDKNQILTAWFYTK
jgi:hypothetical protein